MTETKRHPDWSVAAPDTEAPELDDPPIPWDDWGPKAQERTLRPLAELFTELDKWKKDFGRDL